MSGRNWMADYFKGAAYLDGEFLPRAPARIPVVAAAVAWA